MIVNWAPGTAIAAALTIASLCVIAAGLEATRRERRAQRELQHLGRSFTEELLNFAQHGVVTELAHLMADASESTQELSRWVQAKAKRDDDEVAATPAVSPDIARGRILAATQAFRDAAGAFQDIVGRAERLPVEVTLMSGVDDSAIAALFAASDGLQGTAAATAAALERIDGVLAQDFGPERPISVLNEVAGLLTAHETIDKAANSMQALAEAISPRRNG